MCSILKVFKASGIIIIVSLLLIAPTACMATHTVTGTPTPAQIPTSSNDVKVTRVIVMSTATLGMASFMSQNPVINDVSNSISTSGYQGNYVFIVVFEATSSAVANTNYAISLVPNYAGMSAYTGLVEFAPIEISQQSLKAFWSPCSDLEGKTLINAHPGDTENVLVAYSYTTDIKGLYRISCYK